MNFMKKTILASLIILSFACQDALAWGKPGHQTVVAVAQRHITERAKNNLEKYFAYDIKEDAVWMDKHRKDKDIAYTTAWHVYSLDTKDQYDPNARAHKGDAAYALWLCDYNLRDGKWMEATDSAVVMNVRMLIHFVGDFHCPTHCYIDGRRSFWDCTLNGKNYGGFHGLYDKIPDLLYPNADPDVLAAQLDNCSKREIKKICKGDVCDWAHECAVNNRLIYEINPFGTPELDPETLEKSRELVNTQLRNAGYRLAYLINKYFDR